MLMMMMMMIKIEKIVVVSLCLCVCVFTETLDPQSVVLTNRTQGRSYRREDCFL